MNHEKNSFHSKSFRQCDEKFNEMKSTNDKWMQNRCAH